MASPCSGGPVLVPPSGHPERRLSSPAARSLRSGGHRNFLATSLQFWGRQDAPSLLVCRPPWKRDRRREGRSDRSPGRRQVAPQSRRRWRLLDDGLEDAKTRLASGGLGHRRMHRRIHPPSRSRVRFSPVASTLPGPPPQERWQSPSRSARTERRDRSPTTRFRRRAGRTTGAPRSRSSSTRRCRFAGRAKTERHCSSSREPFSSTGRVAGGSTGRPSERCTGSRPPVASPASTRSTTGTGSETTARPACTSRRASEWTTKREGTA